MILSPSTHNKEKQEDFFKNEKLCFSFNPCDQSLPAQPNSNSFYKKLNVDKHLMVNDLPNKLEICDVDVVFTAQIEGVLSHNASLSKQGLRHFILCNERKNSGFLLWISSYFLSCIFQHQAQKGAKIDQKVMAFKI